MEFAGDIRNKDLQRTVTSVDIPNDFIDLASPIHALGEGPALHFPDEILLDIYEVIDLPKILHAPGFPTIGCIDIIKHL